MTWRIPCFWRRMASPGGCLGWGSLAGTTVRDPARFPGHLAANEHHADWAAREGYVATTVGGGCILGIALTSAADDVHLQEAYGVFAAEWTFRFFAIAPPHAGPSE